MMMGCSSTHIFRIMKLDPNEGEPPILRVRIKENILFGIQRRRVSGLAGR
jgi:hypothetical protein